MANLGKKILSAFVVTDDDKKTVNEKPGSVAGKMPKGTDQIMMPSSPATVNSYTAVNNYTPAANSKFAAYFDKLFSEANIPGPDYYEFSKMIEVMKAVPDEQVRYTTAFAGLSVQGLDKQKLLSTAAQYLQLLETDAANFLNSVDTALKEKVHEKKKMMEEKEKRIQQLTQEISNLQNELITLQGEIKENEEKIEANTGGYKYESEAFKSRIAFDIEKIKRYI